MARWSPSLFGIVVGSLGILWNVIQIIGVTVIWFFYLDDNDKVSSGLTDYGISCIALGIPLIILNIFLIIGIHKKRHRYMIPWLIFSFMAWIYYCIKIFCVSVLGFVIPGQRTDVTIWDPINVIALVLSTIVIRTIYRLYKDIRNENSIKHEKKGDIVTQLASKTIQPLSLSNKVPPPSYAELQMLAEKGEIS